MYLIVCGSQNRGNNNSCETQHVKMVQAKFLSPISIWWIDHHEHQGSLEYCNLSV